MNSAEAELRHIPRAGTLSISILVLAAFFGGCASTEPKKTPNNNSQPEEMTRSPGRAAQKTSDASPEHRSQRTDGSKASLPKTRAVQALLEGSTQLLVALSESWDSPKAKLYPLARNKADWQLSPLGEIEAVVGYKGMAWGFDQGALRQALEPKEQVATLKVEGDGRSPAGLFALGSVYGYAKHSSGISLPYQQVDHTWRCVSDSKSRHYNQIFSQKGVTKDWNEAERMRRRDGLYEFTLEVDHNALIPRNKPPGPINNENGGAGTILKPVPTQGSCIFLHVWREAGSGTLGCVASERKTMLDTLRWLKSEAKPQILILPQELYPTAARLLGLPAQL